MFANSFQSGPHVQVFDSKVNRQKNQFYTKLVKFINSNGIKKQFDKQTKSYLLQIDGLSRLSFPQDDQKELCLVQRYLVLQIYIPIGFPWSIELGLTDTTKTKRRVMLTSAINKIEAKFFHIRCPINQIKRGVWLNLGIDVYSYMNAFKGQTFRSLDQIIIGAHCKLRRIFTMRQGLIEYSNEEQFFQYNNEQGKVFMPKQFQLNPDVVQTTQVISYNNYSQMQKQIRLKETEINNITKVSDKKSMKKVETRKPSVSIRQKEQESKMFEIQKLPVIPAPKTIPINRSSGGVKSRIDTGLNSRSGSSKLEINPKKQLVKEQIKSSIHSNTKSKDFQKQKEISKITKKEQSKVEQMSRADQLKKQLRQYEDQQFDDQCQTTPESQLQIKPPNNDPSEHEQNCQKQQSGNQFMVSPQKLVKQIKQQQQQQPAKTKYQEYEEEYDYGQFQDSMNKNDSFEDSMDPKVPQKQSVYNKKTADNMFPTSIITKKNQKTVVLQIKPEQQVDLIYDQVLDCYFNPNTNTYYELN